MGASKNTDESTDAQPNAAILDEAYIGKILSVQDRMYAYIFSLVGNPDAADEVLQEANLVLTRKADEGKLVNNFGAWACKVSFFQVKAYRQRIRRDRHLFDDEVLGLLATSGEKATEDLSPRHQALRECLEVLPSKHRELAMDRYAPGGSVQEIARESNRTVGAISQTLYRIRAALLECIERKLSVEKGS